MHSFFVNLLILFAIVLACGTSLRAAATASLMEISISPESRVKVAAGEAPCELTQGSWCEFDLTIDNAAGITAPLRIESENLISEADAKSSRDSWLRLELVPSGPLTGKRSEVRKLRLWTDHSGVRSAILNVDAGQGTQDLGFRSDLLLNFKIARATDGWWSGVLNLDCPLADVPAVMKSKELNIAQVNTWTNDASAWTDRVLPSAPVSQTPDGRFYDVLGGMDERGGGSLLMLGLKAPFPLAGYPEKTREWPPSAFFLEMAKRRGAWIDAGSATSLDFPVWLASGKLDSVGVGGLNGDSQDLYFRALNCGLRLPPSSGADAAAKMEIQVGEALTSQGWWDGFKAGRVIVTNGPSLRVTANGKLPGDVMANEQGPLQVLLAGALNSDDSKLTIELIRNGQVDTIKLPALVTLHESGWFAVRATAKDDPKFRFAMTAPWYVEIGGEAMKPRKQDAEFFLGRTRHRMEEVKNAIPELEKQRSAFATLAVAEAFWRQKVGSAQPLVRVHGQIADAATKTAMPARIYIRNAAGAWFFPASDGGTAIRYEKRNFNNLLSSENHTTLSAHPWTAELPPGNYTITVERGKEWRPLVQEIVVKDEIVNLELPVERWVNMAEAGWYSGETHVHRTLADLPNVMLAEDLNVAFPISYWCLHGKEVPIHFDKGTDPTKVAELIAVDATHVIWPCNTEWEVFGIEGREHTLGAVFALGHHTPFKLGAPPLTPIAEAAREQGALLDMDKPDWPWAMALPPVMGINLYELSNNHVWRVPFALTKWTTPAPSWMLPNASVEGDERDWIEYLHQTYWALLNCGQRLRPSAGTASGVHPVPLGYSRVYVHCPDGFSYRNWRAGLEAGRSFVTTGPMCISDVRRDGSRAILHADVRGEQPLGTVEIIVNGAVHETINLNSRQGVIDREIPLDGTTWIALRVWEPQPDGRLRFAHTAPVWFDDSQKPLRPRREQAEFLAKRVSDEISRSTPLLPAAAIQEYQRALYHWQSLTEVTP